MLIKQKSFYKSEWLMIFAKPQLSKCLILSKNSGLFLEMTEGIRCDQSVQICLKARTFEPN